MENRIKDIFGDEIKDGDLIISSSTSSGGSNNLHMGVFKGKSVYCHAYYEILEEKDFDGLNKDSLTRRVAKSRMIVSNPTESQEKYRVKLCEILGIETENRFKNNNEIIKSIEKIVDSNYNSMDCGRTSEGSAGNSDDCFNDGECYGRSWLAYEIGCVLGMSLEDPEQQKYSWED